MLQHKIMKALVVFAVVLSFLCPIMASTPGPVTGKWQGAVTIKNESGETQSQPVFLILAQDGKKLTGTGGPSEEEQGFNIDNGVVDGNKVTFDVTVDDAQYHSSAQVTENELTGETIREQTNGVKVTFKLALKRVTKK
ncbi:MAG TPA: hypothetical protein VHA33_21155 [Candidatus Angelobacter sp.]|jgi:hypothetical protein|nr:hypothetical protein [Candidatus Angelobacter sp.]